MLRKNRKYGLIQGRGKEKKEGNMRKENGEEKNETNTKKDET